MDGDRLSGGQEVYLLFRKEKAGSILTDVVNYLLRTTRGVAVGLILLFL